MCVSECVYSRVDCPRGADGGECGKGSDKQGKREDVRKQTTAEFLQSAATRRRVPSRETLFLSWWWLWLRRACTLSLVCVRAPPSPAPVSPPPSCACCTVHCAFALQTSAAPPAPPTVAATTPLWFSPLLLLFSFLFCPTSVNPEVHPPRTQTHTHTDTRARGRQPLSHLKPCGP